MDDFWTDRHSLLFFQIVDFFFDSVAQIDAIMTGYWFAYEDESTWSSAISNVCTTIVNYGVEIPWCVCNSSNALLATVVEYVTVAALTVYAFLGMEAWWRTEYTLLTAFFLMDLPFALQRAKGNRLALLSGWTFFLTSMFVLGASYELFAGVQGGVVFGGKLFYPTIALFAMSLQLTRVTIAMLDKEVYGYTSVKAEDRVEKYDRASGMFQGAIKYEAMMCMALATFGLPKLEADTDPITWLFVFPLLAIYKDTFKYYGIAGGKPCVAANGDVVSEKKEEPAAKEDKKAEEPAKKEEKAAAKKDDDKKEEGSGEEEKKAEEPAAPAKSSLVARAKGVACACLGTCLAAYGRFMAAADCALAKVAALPWDMITNVVFTVGINVTFTFTLWTLTEDCAALSTPLFTLILPKILRKYEDKVGADRAVVLLAANGTGFSALQYYLFKTNITQAF